MIATPAHRGNNEPAREYVPDPGSTLIRKVHTRVSGRARFMVATLYRSESVKHRLETGLRRISGIKSVKANVLSGNLLVVFAQDRSTEDIAVLVLQQLGVDSSPAPPPDARSHINVHTGPRDENAFVGVHAAPVGLVGPASLIYMQMRFLGSFAVGLLQMSPILIFLTLSVITMGQIVGKKEGWSRGDALYYSFITATTVGYGDLRPTKTSSKALSVGIAFVGMVFTGIVASIGLHSAQHTFASTQSLVKH